MNKYAIIILAALILTFILNLISDYLNLKNIKSQLPEEFRDVFDDNKYRKSQNYMRENTFFGIVSSVYSLAIMLIFWFAGGFNMLDLWLMTHFSSEIWRGLAYIGVLIAGQFVITLPFSIYSTFIIEEKYGFNKTTPGLFIADIAKSLLLAAIIGGPILAGLIYLFNQLGPGAWLYGWAGFVLISLLFQYIGPTLIMPFFNKFKPLEDGELRSAIFQFAQKVNFPLKNIFVMDGSKRSTKSNAFFTGFGNNKRIALFDTLIDKHTKGELVAILAHEIGHYKKKHILTGMFVSFIHFGLLFFLLSIFLYDKGLFEAFYMEYQSVYAGLVLFGLLYTPLEVILSIFMNIRSRKNEFQADKFAAENIENKEDMINALKQLSSDNLSNLTPHPFYVFMNYSHPPVLQRIKKIKEI